MPFLFFDNFTDNSCIYGVGDPTTMLADALPLSYFPALTDRLLQLPFFPFLKKIISG